MPTAKKVYCTSSQEPKRRINRLQRPNGRYASGPSGESDGACRVVVDYTPPSMNSAVTRTRPALPESLKTSASTAASASASSSNNSKPSSSSSSRVRLPPPRLVAPPSKRRRMMQEQRTRNVTLPSWEAFHRTQQQVEPRKKSPSPLDALASVAMRESVPKKQPAHGATSKLNIRRPQPRVHVPLKKETYAEQLTRQKQEQGQLIYLQEMELQKAAALQKIHEANLVAQAKQHMAAQQQAASLQSGYVNLVMDYNNVPQLQLLPQGLETVSFLPPQRMEYFHQPATALLAQHHLADPRIFIRNGHFPGVTTIKTPDTEPKKQPTATLNEHVASVWQKYNYTNNDVSKLLKKKLKETEDDAGTVPLKKRKMEHLSSLSAAQKATRRGY